MYNLHVDRTIECVKKIVDTNRCAVCDKADGERVRYPCGHTACDDCVIAAEDCLICLTPPSVSASAKPDYVFTQRAENANSLLKACQDLFNIDVYKRQRLSEQLRIEKELFPQCIQAPLKYENKRKSLNSSKTKDKRRSSLFPGEAVSFMKENNMENTVSYVQKWLSNNEGNLARKPFADLNVNHQSNKNIAKLKSSKRITDENKPLCVNKIKRKKSHCKSIIKTVCPKSRKRASIHSPDNYTKKVKSEHVQPDASKNDNDESGIFIDDLPIVIDDSQNIVIDKDRNAWLAVLEADKNKELESTSTRLESRDGTNIVEISSSNKYLSENKLYARVPFYKKSHLLETCKHCNNDNLTIIQPMQVKITTENDSYITIIKVSNTEVKNTDISKKTVSVQTNLSGILEPNKINLKDTNVTELDIDCHTEIPMQSQACVVHSEDLFTDECKNMPKQGNVPKKSVIIEESDSDNDNEYSGPIHVTADIHRSSEELVSGILAEVEDQEFHCARPRRGPRGNTPASTDSSEKENYNPNRIKRDKFRKKKGKKK